MATNEQVLGEHLDHTHDPAATSWLASANQPEAEFPVQNLPFGVYRKKIQVMTSGPALPSASICWTWLR